MLTELQTEIVGLLKQIHTGRWRAITQTTFASNLGIEPRQLRQEIQNLRREGYPIGSSTTNPAGYYWVSDLNELVETLDHLSNRAYEALKTAKYLRKHYLAFGGQMSLLPELLQLDMIDLNVL